jgi:SAM-dependent methyltransferase
VTTDERKRTVAAGYDRLGAHFGEWADQIKGDPWERFLDELSERLPDGARVLDLGCGSGARLARLAGRFELVGVDISTEQIRLARTNVPAASFIHGDFSTLDFEAGSFDAVTALYSIVHVPREEHRALLNKVVLWLKPGGLFLASLAHVGGPDRSYEWLGVEMFFSGFDAETGRRLVLEADFELLLDELVWMGEPEGEVAFLWVLGRKP